MPTARRPARTPGAAVIAALMVVAAGCAAGRSHAPASRTTSPGTAATVPTSARAAAPAADASPVEPPPPSSPAGADPGTLGTTMTEPTTTSTQTTIPYGTDPSQFGVLYFPSGAAPAAGRPVVILIHGGFWRAEYGLDLMVPLAEDLVARGFAVWNIEYRRVGQPGGGWPGTLDDAASAIDELATVAAGAPLDLSRVAVVGHSAGGQLALWAAGRGSIRAGAPGAAPRVVPVLAIGQGPVGDLFAGARDGLGGGAITDLLGGTPADHPDRYAVASPSTATNARLVVVRGEDDTTVPAEYTLPPDHDAVQVIDIPGDDHFDLIDPASAAWAAVVAELTTI